MKATLHTDGGARGNPGPAGIGAVLYDDKGREIAHVAESLAPTTNNVAEYKALIAGLELALQRGESEGEQQIDDLEVKCDSQLVVSQVTGEWKIKNDQLRSLAAKAERLLNKFERWSIAHVPRNENSRADKLANKAMDAATRESASWRTGAQLFLDAEADARE